MKIPKYTTGDPPIKIPNSSHIYIAKKNCLIKIQNNKKIKQSGNFFINLIFFLFKIITSAICAQVIDIENLVNWEFKWDIGIYIFKFHLLTVILLVISICEWNNKIQWI